MVRLLAIIVAVLSFAGCDSLSPIATPSLTTDLPHSVGGQPIAYRELAASDLGDQLVFFQGPITAVNGDLHTARVAIGQGRDGFTLTALRVPEASGVQLLEPLITASQLDAIAREVHVVGGKSVTVLTLPPTTHDVAYVYVFRDTIVMLTTSQPSLADEAMRQLPA